LPFVETGGFVFLLALPSNPAAAPIVRHGTPPLYLRVAGMGRDVGTRFPNQVGLVVGATDAAAARAVADVDGGLPWLVPGIGAQGGDLGAFYANVGVQRTLLISASRSIVFADDPGAAARALKERIQHECRSR
jgi:orotidine-5'-phosphate decarboxylase